MFGWKFDESLRAVAIILVMAVIAACGQTDNDVDLFSSEVKEQETDSSRHFGPDCGLVFNGTFEGGVSASDTIFAESVTVISSNILLLHSASGERLVKLFGIGDDSPNSSAAMSWLSGLAKDGVYYAPASPACVVDTPSGVATSGQVFTPGGRSFSESLIKTKLAGSIDDSGSCGENLLASCYRLIEEAAKNPPSSTDTGSSQSSSSSGGSSSSGEGSNDSGSDEATPSDSVTVGGAGEITDFLWKPSADSSYNKGMMVIHVDECNATVYVNGEKLNDYGPGNGRCNTSRAFKPGCAYGTNVKVTVVDNNSGQRYTRNGLPYVLVPNGCNRFEFKE